VESPHIEGLLGPVRAINATSPGRSGHLKNKLNNERIRSLLKFQVECSPKDGSCVFHEFF
jgi:hypothetical protein